MSNNEHTQLHEGASGVPSGLGGDDPAADELAGMRGTQTLERLKERVEATARELIRLRKDNALLARRLAEMDSSPRGDDDSAGLRFDEDTDTLRARIDSFIQAIDFYLARDRDTETSD